MADKYYTIQEACKLIDKPPFYVWRLLAYFRIPHQKNEDGKVIINKQHFDYVVTQLGLVQNKQQQEQEQQQQNTLAAEVQQVDGQEEQVQHSDVHRNNSKSSKKTKSR